MINSGHRSKGIAFAFATMFFMVGIIDFTSAITISVNVKFRINKNLGIENSPE